MINMFGLQPQARPVDTFTAPQPVSDEIAKLAQGLSGFGNNLADVATKYGGMTAQALEAEATQYAEIQAAKAKNIADFESAIQRGEIKYQDVPWVNTMIRQQIASNMVSKNIIDSMPDFQSKEDQFETSDQVIAYFQAAGANGLDLNDPEVAAVAAPKINETAMKIASGFVQKRSEKRDKDLQNAISDGVLRALQSGSPDDMSTVAQRHSVLVPREKVIESAIRGFEAYALSDPDFAGSEQFENMVKAFTVKDKDGNTVSLLDTAEGLRAYTEIQQKAANLVYQRDIRQVAKEDRERVEQARQTNEYIAGLVDNPAMRNSDGTLNTQAIIAAVVGKDPNTPLAVRASIADQVAGLNRSTATTEAIEFQNSLIRDSVSSGSSINEMMDKPYGTSGMTYGQFASANGLYGTMLEGWKTADNLNNFTDEQFIVVMDAPEVVTPAWMAANSHKLTDGQRSIAANILASNVKGFQVNEDAVKLLETSMKLKLGPDAKATYSSALPGGNPIDPRIDAAVLEFKKAAFALSTKVTDPTARAEAMDKLLWDISRRFGGFESKEKYDLATDADIQRKAQEQQQKVEQEQARIAEEISTPGSRANERFTEYLKNADATMSSEGIFVMNALVNATQGIDPAKELNRIGFGTIDVVNSRKYRSALQKIEDINAGAYRIPLSEKRKAVASLLIRAARGNNESYPNRVLFFATQKDLVANVKAFAEQHGLTPEEAKTFFREQVLTLTALEAKKTYENRKPTEQSRPFVTPR